mmetsp:Transcript_8066/g.21160  ORF Transcript_8066/g.21160 Transcript_8066/m.21160 type:complete len:353 (-) Transcript_8066:518-1576(-)
MVLQVSCKWVHGSKPSVCVPQLSRCPSPHLELHALADGPPGLRSGAVAAPRIHSPRPPRQKHSAQMFVSPTEGASTRDAQPSSQRWCDAPSDADSPALSPLCPSRAMQPLGTAAHDTSTGSSLSPPPPPFFFLGLFFFFFSVDTASSSLRPSSSIASSLVASGAGPVVSRAGLPDGSSITVNLNCATNVPSLSKRTGYSVKRLCFTHSTTPIRQFRSSPARSVNGIVGKRWLTSLKKERDAFILSEYFSEMLRLKTVVRSSLGLGLPSPVDITMSIANTSFFSISALATCCSVLGLLMITLLASITCFFIWWESTPSTGAHLNDSATLVIMSVISLFVHPSLYIRCASSDAW